MESNFTQNISNELERLKEIINMPAKLYVHLEDAYNIHNSIKHQLKEYQDLSLNKIKEEVYNLSLPNLEKYKQNAINDVKTHVIQTSYTIPKLNIKNYKINFIKPDVYDDLYQNIDITMDKNKLTKENIEMIKEYTNIKNEILNEYDNLIEGIKQYEQNMVNFRQELLNKISNEIIPQLYNAHLSYIKNGLENKRNKNKNIIPINVEVNYIQYSINQKQTEFITSMLKKYLEIN